MKRMSRAGAVVCALIFAVVCAMPGAVAAKTIELSFASFLPTTTFCAVGMFHYKDEIEKRTNGKVQIKTYPGGTLLGAKNMIDGVLTGQADIGDACLAYQPGRFPIANALGLPLDIPNAKAASHTLWDLYEKYQPEGFKNLKVLYMYTNTPSNLQTTVPVRTIDDLQGLTIRASGGAGQILKAWGANYVGMPQSDVPEALQKNVIKGLFTSLEVMMDMNYADYCKYITITETVLYPFAVVMNMDTWNKLPKDVQKVFDDMRVEQSEWVGNYIDNHVKKAVGWSVLNRGVEAIQLSKEQKEIFNKRLEPIVAESIANWEAKNIPYRKIIEDIKTLSEKYK